MRISKEKLRVLCRKRQISFAGLLRRAGVSRNAFYSLARKRSVLPRSIEALASELDVSPIAILHDEGSPLERAETLITTVDSIVNRHRASDRDNVRHTLLLLEEKPIDRLRRALTRGQKFNIHRK